MSPQLAHRDLLHCVGRASLTGHCGRGWTCSLPRPVAIDPSLPFAARRARALIEGRPDLSRTSWNGRDRPRADFSSSFTTPKLVLGGAPGMLPTFMSPYGTLGAVRSYFRTSYRPTLSTEGGQDVHF